MYHHKNASPCVLLSGAPSPGRLAFLLVLPMAQKNTSTFQVDLKVASVEKGNYKGGGR